MRLKIDSPIIPVTLGVVLRLVHLKFALHSPVLALPLIDSAYYHNWAVGIADGNILGESAFFMSPLYPYFLGLLYALFGAHPAAGAAAQILLSGISIWMIWLIGRKVSGERAGTIAAFIAAVYPPWIYFDGALLTAPLILFLNTASLLILVKFLDKLRPGQILAAGVLLGLSTLARPNALLFAAVLAVWLITRRMHIAAIIMSLGLIAVISPVTLRNIFVAGEFALTTASGGMNFYVGSNPAATGLYVEPDFLVSSDPGSEFQAYREEAERRSWRELSATGASRYWFKAGLEYIIERPLEAAGLWWKKFFYFWNDLEAPNNVSIYLVKRYSPVVKYIPLGFGLLAAIGLIGLALLPGGDLKKLLWIYLLALLISNMLFFTSSEFRFPAVNVLIIGAGAALTKLYTALREKNIRWELIAAASALMLFTHFRSNIAHFMRSPRMDYYNYGSVCLKEGKLNSAAQFFIESLKEDPAFIEAHMGLGTTYLEMGEYEAAAAEFQTAGYPVDAEYLKENRARMNESEEK